MSSNWFNDLRFKGKVVDKYMTNKSNLVRLIVFTAIFSLCFINLYCPFDSMTWYEEMSRPKYFLVSSLLVLVGILVIAFSRFLMYRFVRKTLALLFGICCVGCGRSVRAFGMLHVYDHCCERQFELVVVARCDRSLQKCQH